MFTLPVILLGYISFRKCEVAGQTSHQLLVSLQLNINHKEVGGLTANETFLPGDLGCSQISCQYEDPAQVVRSDWASVLIYYTLIRCLIDVLRASSVMMFEVGGEEKFCCQISSFCSGSCSRDNQADGW